MDVDSLGAVDSTLHEAPPTEAFEDGMEERRREAQAVTELIPGDRELEVNGVCGERETDENEHIEGRHLSHDLGQDVAVEGDRHTRGRASRSAD